MYLGFSFDRIDAGCVVMGAKNYSDEEWTKYLDHSDFYNESQEKLDNLCESIENISFMPLGFEQIAYILDPEKFEMPSRIISSNDSLSFDQKTADKLQELRNYLIRNGFDVDCQWELITEPEWTRHGECLNYA